MKSLAASLRAPGQDIELQCIRHFDNQAYSAFHDEQNIQVFEVEDPEGPLETPGEDIGQQFGRLQIKSAAELGLPPGQLSELASAQGDAPQPTLEQDLKVWKHHVGIPQHRGETLISIILHVHMLADCSASLPKAGYRVVMAGYRVVMAVLGSRVGLRMTGHQS